MERKNFLKTPLGKVWKKIGTEKRAGVIIPLFSIYSKNSTGIGEILDLKLAVDWCHKTGNSILQILPINDNGFLASPFSPQSSIALNPIYVSLSKLVKTPIEIKMINRIKKKYPTNSKRINYALGSEKLILLKEVFKRTKLNSSFYDFAKKNEHWIKDYSLFKALKNHHNQKTWKKWPEKYQNRNQKALNLFERENKKEILFWQWIQWILFQQMKEVRNYAKKKRVLLKGDLPLFVSEDSADCWSFKKYFKFNLSAGAPPDYFTKKGQRWGMPVYNWKAIEKNNFTYFVQRFKYAENFYDLIRIDHVIGLFRTWAISTSSSKKLEGEKGSFVPEKEKNQIELGEKIIDEIIKSSQMLPCAEDLGTIPDFCRQVIKEKGIPGLDIARNQKEYRALAVSSLSTHDLNLFPAWQKKHRIKIDDKKIKENLIDINLAPSVFSILLIFEWLFLGEINPSKSLFYRINNPADSLSNNWTIKIPLSLEELLKSKVNSKIKKILKDTNRYFGL